MLQIRTVEEYPELEFTFDTSERTVQACGLSLIQTFMKTSRLYYKMSLSNAGLCVSFFVAKNELILNVTFRIARFMGWELVFDSGSCSHGILYNDMHLGGKTLYDVLEGSMKDRLNTLRKEYGYPQEPTDYTLYTLPSI